MKTALGPLDIALLLLAAVMVAVASAVNMAGMPVITDDAFIVLVYARHLVEGQGLVWNDQPVEGFTSFLDLMVKSAGTALTEDAVRMSFGLSVIFQIGCALLVMTLSLRLNQRAGNHPRLCVAWAGFAGSVAALLLFRRLYFGYWAPNTYYAKSSSSRWVEIQDGVLYLVQAGDSFYGIILLGLAVFGGLLLTQSWWKSQTARRVARVCALMASAAILTTVLGGGDSYDNTRFVALPFTLSLVLVVVGITGLRGIHRAVAINVLAAMTLLQCVEMFDRFENSIKRMSRWPHDLSHYQCDRQFSRWLAVAAPDLDIAQSDFQRLKFFAESLRVVDLRGLNDEAIAHLELNDSVRWGKFDHELAVKINPPIWIWGRHPYTKEPMANHAMEALLGERELIDYFTDWPDLPVPIFTAAGARMVDSYLPVSVKVCQGYYNLLVHKNLARRLRESGALVGETQ